MLQDACSHTGGRAGRGLLPLASRPMRGMAILRQLAIAPRFTCTCGAGRGLLVYAMPSTGKANPQAFNFLDLTVWKTKLPDVQFAVLPAYNNRPNPLATPDRLYASVFAPGAICALEPDRGKLIWRRELPKYAGASVELHEGKLLAKTENTLFALNPDSGENLWAFCPYGSDGESIYSCPSAHENRIYIGDRTGCLHCLDAESGKTIWKRRTKRGRNGDVNSTPVLMHGLVIVSNNAKTALAYDALSGKLEWKQKLDGPSSFGPLAHQDSVLAVSNSLYLLNSRTGKVRRRFSWSGLRPKEADSTPQGYRPDVLARVIREQAVHGRCRCREGKGPGGGVQTYDFHSEVGIAANETACCIRRLVPICPGHAAGVSIRLSRNRCASPCNGDFVLSTQHSR